MLVNLCFHMFYKVVLLRKLTITDITDEWFFLGMRSRMLCKSTFN